jgi:hypothetical protein
MENFFNNSPKPLRILLALCLSVAMIWGVVEFDPHSSHKPPTPEETDKETEVKFIVVGKDKQPIEGAKIQFISDGAPEIRLTNTDGYVRIKIPSREDINIILSKEGFETIDKIINLRVDSLRTRTFTLEKSSLSSESNNCQGTDESYFQVPIIL